MDIDVRVYETWLRNEPGLMNSLHELEGKYISMYNQVTTVTETRGNDHRLCNHGFVLMRVAREQGVNVLGVTTEHKTGGRYTVDHDLPREYLGKRNFFTGKRKSKWSMV